MIEDEEEESSEEDETLKELSAKKNERGGRNNRAAQLPSTGNNVPVAENWIYGEWLMTFSLEELENMATPQELYMKCIGPGMKIMRERLSRMRLGERHVEVNNDWPMDKELSGFPWHFVGV